MFLITRRKQFGPTTFLWDVKAPDVARAARPGHFVMARIDEHGERIPLTVADFNAERGTVTVVIQAVGKTTLEMLALREGDTILDFIGPLGLPSHIRKLDGTVVLVGGGLGVAPIYPQLREYKKQGNRTISIVGFRNRDLIFWEDQFRECSDELIVTTDDGSYGRKGFVTHALADVLSQRKGRPRSGRHRPHSHDEGVLRSHAAVRHSDRRQPELHHGGWHRHVRIVPRHGGRQDEVRLRGRRRFRRPPGQLRRAVSCARSASRAKRRPRMERFRSESAKLAGIPRIERGDRRTPGAACELPEAIPETPAPRIPKNIKTIPPERAPMPHQPAEARVHNFKEVALGLDLEGALHEAERCLRCKKPRCVPGCPVGIDIPGFISALARKDVEQSYRILKSSNALPAVCGRVCPQESQCEATCVVGAKFKPVAIGRLERFVADAAMGRGWDEAPATGDGRGDEARGHHRLAVRRAWLAPEIWRATA